MDKLAAACGLDPVEIRLRNAMETGDRLITGQVDRERRARRAVHPRDRRAAAARRARRRPRRRPDAPARRRRPHRRRGAHPPRHRLGRGDQEPDVLRGLRRLLDGALPAGRRRGLAEVRDRARSARASSTLAAQIARIGARCRRRRARADRHHDRLGRLDVGVAPDVDERGRGRRRVPPGARAAVRARRRGARRRSAAAGDRRARRRRHDGRRCAIAGRRGDGRRRRSTRRSSTTTGRPRTSTRTARATATRRSRSSPTARSSTSTPSSAWSRSCRSPPRRTSVGR